MTTLGRWTLDAGQRERRLPKNDNRWTIDAGRWTLGREKERRLPKNDNPWTGHWAERKNDSGRTMRRERV